MEGLNFKWRHIPGTF